MDYEECLLSLASADERIIVLTAENRAAIRGVPDRLRDRFVDAGISEQALVGVAAGLALAGRIAIVHGIAAFLTMRAFEFIRTDVALPRLPVKLVGSFAGFLSEANGPTHQALEDIALMRAIPGMRIFCPADRQELVDALPSIAGDGAPWYVRYNPAEPAVRHRAPFEPGRAEVLSTGSDVAILTAGLLVREAVRARNDLLIRGVSARVVNLRTLEPLDREAILAAATEARLLVTLEDHFLTGGIYSAVCEALVESRSFAERPGAEKTGAETTGAEATGAEVTPAEVMPIAFEKRWFKPALLADSMAYEGFTGEQIVDRILKRMGAASGAPVQRRSSEVSANTISFNSGYPSITASDAYYSRSLGLIPAATQTLAKGPGQHVMGVAPKYLSHGKGSHVWDVDGNEYIDYSMGVGPISLGYCYGPVDDAIREQLARGITFSLMSPLEVEVAEAIRRLAPGAEMVRYSKTGADVTSAAVRLARAFTGRERVLCCGYHGWHDWYVGVTSRAAGVPGAVKDLTSTFEYNDLESAAASMDEDTACVILEPVVFEEPRDDFLHGLKDLCQRSGALLIFDEMWTGFRLAPGGAQEFFDVRADLACYSKAIANGMPLSVLAGRSEVMSLLENDVFFFTTFGGEALSLAACKATLAEIADNRTTEHIAMIGGSLRKEYNRLAARMGMGYTRCIGMDCRTLVVFDGSAGDPLELKSLVQQELIKRGVLWNGFHNICYSHTAADVDHTLAAYEEALAILRQAVDSGDVRARLRGKPVEPVFRKTSGFNSKPGHRKRGPRNGECGMTSEQERAARSAEGGMGSARVATEESTLEACGPRAGGARKTE